MSYYPAWFDYAKWLFIAVGAVCAFEMLSEPAGRRRGWLKLGFCCSLATAMLFGGTAGVLFNSRAGIHEVTGQVFRVSSVGGKGAETCFSLPQPFGEFDFSIRGENPAISNGEVLHVVYQDASYLVLKIDVLEGPSSGYNYTDSVPFLSSWLVVVAALALAGYGLWDWAVDGTAIPPPDTTASPDGDVDTKSLLNLSKD